MKDHYDGVRRMGWAPAAIVLAMLLAPAVQVLSEGGGDYPPPASGDWVITQDTWVANETIQLRGNLSILDGTLRLNNSTLIANLTDGMVQISVAEGAALEADDSIITVSHFMEPLAINLHGGARIRNCSFTRYTPSGLSGISIVIDSPDTIITGCLVEGALRISDGLSPVLDGTVITAVQYGIRFGAGVHLANVETTDCVFFGAEGGNNSTIMNCSFNGIFNGWSYDGFGLVISSDTIVQDCSFTNLEEGLFCWEGEPRSTRNVTVKDCDFFSCMEGISMGTDILVQSCRFYTNIGIGWASNVTVDGCDFNGSYYHDGGTVVISDNGSVTVKNSTCRNHAGPFKMKDVSSFFLYNTTITDYEGDAIFANNTKMDVQDCVFSPAHRAHPMDSNFAANMTNGNASKFKFTDCTFQQCNRAISCDEYTSGIVTGCIFNRPEGPQDIENATIISRKGFDIRDSVISGGNDTEIDVIKGQFHALNLSFSSALVDVEEGASFEVAWYLDTTIIHPNGTPAEGAGLRISDRSGKVLSTLSSGPSGRTPRQEVTEYLREWNRTTYFTPLSLNASKDGIARNISVNLNQNMDLTLTLADVTAPSVRFTSPANNTLLNRTSCVFSGTASDDQGIASVRLRAGSGEWVTAGGTTDWNATLDLLEGENRIVAEASDGEGNAATTVLSVRVDSLPPVVEITYPSQDLLVNTTSIELTGRTEPGCTVLVGGEAAPFYLGQFSATVAIQEGPNTIVVSARDAAGNTGHASVNVTRDTIPPALTLTSPLNGEVTGQAIVNISGTAEPGARVSVNDIILAPAGPFFSVEAMLSEGVNSITVQAVDAAGNRAALTVRVILDRTPPPITVELRNGTVVSSPTFRLAGRAEPGASLSVNGVPVPVAGDGNFSTTVTLRPGPNRIRIEATDPSGNSASLDRTVTFEQPPAPRPPEPPETGQAFNAGLAAGTALMAIAIVAFAWLFVRGKRPPPSDRDVGKSGSLPAGREP